MKNPLHRVIKLLPAKVRREILPAFLGFVVGRVIVSRRKYMPGPVTIVGLLSSTVGLGQGARLALSAFGRLGYVVRSLDVGNIFYWHKNLAVDLGVGASELEGGIIVFHLNPPELAMVLPMLGRRLILHKKIVGYWAWELDVIPDTWKVAYKLVDEIWVPSSFVAKALSHRVDVPVRVIHHPLHMAKECFPRRMEYGLSEGQFVVLTMFDMRSSAARKNPVGSIRAFKGAFGARADVILIVKIGNPSEAPEVMANIEAEVGDARNIRLMFDKLSLEDHLALIKSADVIMSLHRSEGFGLIMAEAMLLGKAVIATAYSGNMDFMNAESAILINYEMVPVNDPQGIYGGTDQFWADPDIVQASQWLQRLAADPELRVSYARKAREQAERIFNLNTFRIAIGEIEGLITTQDEEKVLQ